MFRRQCIPEQNKMSDSWKIYKKSLSNTKFTAKNKN